MNSIRWTDILPGAAARSAIREAGLRASVVPRSAILR